MHFAICKALERICEAKFFGRHKKAKQMKIKVIAKNYYETSEDNT